MTRHGTEKAGPRRNDRTVPPDPASGPRRQPPEGPLELVEVGFVHDGAGGLAVAGANGRGGAA